MAASLVHIGDVMVHRLTGIWTKQNKKKNVEPVGNCTERTRGIEFVGTGYFYRRNNLTSKFEPLKSQCIIEVTLGSLFGEFRQSNVGLLNLPDSVIVKDFRVVVKDMHEAFIVKTFFHQ